MCRDAEQERLHVLLTLSDAVRHRPHRPRGQVADYLSIPHHHERREGLRRIAHLAGSLPAVHLLAECLAGVDVARLESPDLDAIDRSAARLAAHDHHRLGDVEPERLVEAERAHVEAVL